MSTWTYAICHTCKKKLWLEKFFGYHGLRGSYRLAEKAADLARFFDEHSHHMIGMVREPDVPGDEYESVKESWSGRFPAEEPVIVPFIGLYREGAD